MRRDMDLIRLILLNLEGEEEVDLSYYGQEQIEYHQWLLLDAGLAQGTPITSMGDSHPRALLFYLNWQGHEFLDSARNDTIWRQAREAVESNLGTVSIKVLTALLTALAKQQLGL